MKRHGWISIDNFLTSVTLALIAVVGLGCLFGGAVFKWLMSFYL